MNWKRTEEEVDEIIQNLIENSKSVYIHQGVTFRKDSPSQLRLLKLALMSSYSFGGFVKDLLDEQFNNDTKDSSKIKNNIEKIEEGIADENKYNEFENENITNTNEKEIEVVSSNNTGSWLL